MTFTTVALTAWMCDRCGLEAIHAGDDFPDGWTCLADGESHICAVCAGWPGART